jgi:hypothetical protein
MTENEKLEVQTEDEEQDWLPEESKRIVRRRPPDYQMRSGNCESCQ